MDLTRFSTIFKPKFVITLLCIWQFFSVLLIAIGIWPASVVWVNLGLLTAFMLASETFYSMLLVIVSIPFSVAIPSSRFPSLPVWRILIAVLFFVWVVRDLEIRKNINTFFKKILFLEWDKYLLIFMGTCLLPVFWTKFPLPGIKQIIFWLNLYCLYLVLVNTVKTKERVVKVIKATAASVGFIVLLGYAQLFVTFLSNLDTFWVYWASFVSKLYYGPELSTVLLYSNSWFSYVGDGTELRMFSIMPDSHSFAMMAIYCISFLIPLTYFFDPNQLKAKKQRFYSKIFDLYNKKFLIVDHEHKTLGITVNYYLWTAIRFAGLAIILSGTRAAWVGLLAPLFILIFTYYSGAVRLIVKKTLWPYIIIILFFALSPLINQGLHFLRVSKFEENFLERARSIYDLNEESNMGRIEIWKSSLSYGISHPFGVGLNNFSFSLNQNDSSSLDHSELSNLHNERFNLPNKYVTAHNLYLHLLVEVGFLGLLAFGVFWFKYFWKVEQFIRRRKNDNNIFVFFVFEIALTFVWFLAAGMFDVTLLNDKVLIYLFISLGLSGIIMNKYEELMGNDKN